MAKQNNTLLLVGAGVVAYLLYQKYKTSLIGSPQPIAAPPPAFNPGLVSSTIVNPQAGIPDVGSYYPSLNPVGETITFN